MLLVGGSVAVSAQSSSPTAPLPSNSQKPDTNASKPSPVRQPDLSPPRSDRVNADALGDGQSSSKDTQIDLAPPQDDTKAHPKSAEILQDAENAPGNTDVGEFHPWDPHKAAKDVEVGDFYFKRKNYHAAEDRYREALYYKDNDAIATFRLGVCLEKMDRPGEARDQFQKYLTILPHGPESEEAQKAIDRLKMAESKGNAAQ